MLEKKKKLLIIGGPTAVGKSDIAVKLAKKLNGEIISADSMQIYKYMDIGSAKITNEEMENIPHYLIDFLNPKEEFSVSEFKELCLKHINDIYSRGKLPIIVGGTGLYVNSIICNLTFTESQKDDDYRKHLFELANEKGNEHIHSLLKEVDPKAAEDIHFNNTKRVIRALEVYHLTGKPFSSYNLGNEIYTCPYDLHYYVLNMDRAKLYKRINLRVDLMIKNGLIEEVKKLQSMGLTSDIQSMKGIGYKEVLDYLDDKVSLESTIDSIKQGSRNYAKRQITWFKKDPRAEFIDKDKYTNDLEIIDKITNDIM